MGILFFKPFKWQSSIQSTIRHRLRSSSDKRSFVVNEKDKKPPKLSFCNAIIVVLNQVSVIKHGKP